MQKKLKIMIFSGLLIMLMLSGVALFMRIVHPADAFDSAAARAQLCLRLVLEIRGDIYRCSTSTIHIPDSVNKKIDEAERILQNFRSSAYADSVKGLPVYAIFSSCTQACAEVLTAYKNIIQRYNGLGGIDIRYLDSRIINTIEALTDSYIQRSKTFFREGDLAAKSQMKKNIVISAILIVGTWLLGLLVTWMLVKTLYTFFLARAHKKQIVIRLGPKQPSMGSNAYLSGDSSNASMFGSLHSSSDKSRDLTVCGAADNPQALAGVVEADFLGSTYSDRVAVAANKESGICVNHKETGSDQNSHMGGISRHGMQKIDSNQQRQLTQTAGMAGVFEKEIADLRHSYTQLDRSYQDLQTAYSKLEQQHAESNLISKKSDDNMKIVLYNVQETAAAHIRNTDTVRELVETFHSGQNLFRENHANMQYIVQNVSKIREMSEMSESIAEQIKMLGMNAAIEAAHAGDAGKGFSVVAEELSRLGAAALESSHEIGGTITHIIKTITQIGTAGDDLDKAFEKLNGQTGQIYDSLTSFSSKMDKTSQDAQDILAQFNGKGTC